MHTCVYMQAYSVYDREVGYCQGSPFIAGVLLLHVREWEGVGEGWEGTRVGWGGAGRGEECQEG